MSKKDMLRVTGLLLVMLANFGLGAVLVTVIAIPSVNPTFVIADVSVLFAVLLYGLFLVTG